MDESQKKLQSDIADAGFGLYSDEELREFANYRRAPTAGKHDDDGKRRYDLIPIKALREEADVWGYGAKKYGQKNWEQGIHWSRLFASTLRHLYKWWGGTDRDEESGLLHLAHARCCLGMLLGLSGLTSLDDRPKPVLEVEFEKEDT